MNKHDNFSTYELTFIFIFLILCCFTFYHIGAKVEREKIIQILFENNTSTRMVITDKNGDIGKCK